MSVRVTIERWGALWYSRTRLDGVRGHFLFDGGKLVLFRTRREARAWIVVRYGYIGKRSDLQREPYGWRVPRAVRVLVVLKEVR